MGIFEICEHCGKRKKRFRVAFRSWICDNCKIETESLNLSDQEQTLNNWWNFKSLEEKKEIFNQMKGGDDNGKRTRVSG